LISSTSCDCRLWTPVVSPFHRKRAAAVDAPAPSLCSLLPSPRQMAVPSPGPGPNKCWSLSPSPANTVTIPCLRLGPACGRYLAMLPGYLCVHCRNLDNHANQVAVAPLGMISTDRTRLPGAHALIHVQPAPPDLTLSEARSSPPDDRFPERESGRFQLWHFQAVPPAFVTWGAGRHRVVTQLGVPGTHTDISHETPGASGQLAIGVPQDTKSRTAIAARLSSLQRCV